MAPTIPVYTLDIDAALRTTAPQELAAQALSRFRVDAARARSQTAQDIDARSCTVVLLGDSLTEAFSPTVRGFMWPLALGRRLAGQRLGHTQYIPAAANTFSDRVASSWPGGQAPWTYSVDPAGDVTHGADLHAVVMQSGSTATLTFYGETVNVVYTRTTGGPSAAAVTLDGAAQTAINANGSELPGRIVTYVADGYGFHTLVITSTSGQLLLEGAVVTDNEVFALGVACRGMRVLTFGHGGFQTSDFLTRPNWSTSLTALAGNSATGNYPSLFIIGLGSNDQVQSTPPGTFAANLSTIIATIDSSLDAAGITTDPGFLLLGFPNQSSSYVDQLWTVRNTYPNGRDRIGVLDLRHYYARNGVDFDIFNSAGHPTDGGHLWIANIIGDFLDGNTNFDVERPAPDTARLDVKIDATTPPVFRSNWTQSLATVSATNGTWRDATPASSTVAERRHRVWLEPGVYTPALRYGEVTTLGGEWQVLVRGVSLGTTGATTGTTGNVVGTALSSTVTIDSPGAYPVVIRKTGLNAGAAHFIDLVLRKTT